jgi:hypothetical protein
VPLRLLAVAIALASLILRLWHRDGLYPGWDIVGAAEGLRLLSTESPAAILRWLYEHQFDASLGWNVYGVPLVLVPGALTWLHPWEHWSTVTNLGFTAAAFALAAWAVLPPGQRWPILLGVGASGALLSSASSGFAYGSSFWPYAVALAVVFRGRRLLRSLLATLFALLLAWHVQDLGPTACAVFLLGAVARRDAPLPLRLLWLAGGALGAYLALAHPPAIVITRSGVPGLEHLESTAERVVAIFRGPMRPDTPILLPLAVVAALLLRRERPLWWGLLALQVVLVAWLALTEGPDRIWPRRLLLLDSLAVLVVAVAATQRPRWRPLLLGALAVANVWQLAETVAWARAPIDTSGTNPIFPLPYTHTTVDYMVDLPTSAWLDEIQHDIDAGKRIILVYNLGAYAENATNPTAIPERLYIRLGHERFMDTVLMFGSAGIRSHPFPVRPLEDLEPVLGAIRDPDAWVVHFILHPMDTPDARAEYARIRDAIKRHFVLGPAPGNQPPAGGELRQRGIIAPRPTG